MMLKPKNIKFFTLSGSMLEYREIRLFKTKLIGFTIAGGLFVFGILVGLNFLAGDPLDFGHGEVSAVLSENRMLKDQLRDITKRTGDLQKSLQTLAERGNELRLMVDLSTIDDDTRKAAVGGSAVTSDVEFLGSEAEKLLSRADGLIDQLLREVRLQQTSYEEINKRYEYNAGRFSHLPAIKPMSGYYSVNGFGMRVHPVLRVYRMHEGIDLINDVGTDVYAAGDGVIHYAGRTQGGYGTVIDISHGFGYSSLYAHLSRVLVRPGQKVKRGELIAKSGRSGLVSGPHLHYEVRFNGRKQNPVDYFFDDVNASRYRTLLASSQRSER